MSNRCTVIILVEPTPLSMYPRPIVMPIVNSLFDDPLPIVLTIVIHPDDDPQTGCHDDPHVDRFVEEIPITNDHHLPLQVVVRLLWLHGEDRHDDPPQHRPIVTTIGFRGSVLDFHRSSDLPSSSITPLITCQSSLPLDTSAEPRLPSTSSVQSEHWRESSAMLKQHAMSMYSVTIS